MLTFSSQWLGQNSGKFRELRIRVNAEWTSPVQHSCSPIDLPYESPQ